MLEPEIIFENKDFLVINKPSGLMVHGVKIGAKRAADEKKKNEPTLTKWLLEKYPEIGTVGDDPAVRPGIVHRLDKDTSGAMLVARTQASFERLKTLFQEHKIEKTYFALVFGSPKKEKGIIDDPIGIKNGTLKRSVHSSKMAKPAITEYEILKKFKLEDINGKEKTFSLLEVKPKTGRTHQIRVHLASIGNPIVGDRLYGGRNQPEFAGRLMLHAASLRFSDERGSRYRFEADTPEDFQRVIALLR